MAESVRIDKWLWAARFFKTRSLAAQAVDGGKVQLNGARVKRARALKVGDRLEIHKGGYEFQIHILLLSERRGAASVAQTLYEETTQSIEKRAALSEQHKLATASTPHPQRKPDKKARRQLREMKW
ncbi:MAG: ribosome-associated heat shock protein Hsp15 [Gammaproteobacteria bacterium]|nr:MAG: ribosome-associated heat shock protein Hsp15 [Gammaproteobacteria bacterium]